ncbi:WD40 repeat-like protein [Gyrodon lividus]|nr:WD40 repeat-like protein [Gyrodon lividus]
MSRCECKAWHVNGPELPLFACVPFAVSRYTRLGGDMSSQIHDSAYWPVIVPPMMLLGHTESIRSVAFLPDGRQVISGSVDSSVRAWRVEDGRKVGTVMGEGGQVFAIALSSDGLWVATGAITNKITIGSAVTTHEKVIELKGHSSAVLTLAFSSDSARVVSGSRDMTVIIWCTTTGKRLAGPLRGHTNGVYSVSFSPNGDELASCDARDIRIWNTHSGELVLPPIQTNAFSLAWTPDGQRLIAGCGDGSIKLFDFLTGFLHAEWNGHTDVIMSLAVSPNGKFIASGSWDDTVRLWDTTASAQIGPTLHHDADVHSIAISPNGSQLVSGGDDMKVRIWNLKGVVPPSLVEISFQPADLAEQEESKGFGTAMWRHLGASRRNPLNPAQQDAISSVEGHSSENIEMGKEAGPSLLVSQGVVAGDSDMSSDEAPTAVEQLTQGTARYFNDMSRDVDEVE